MPEVVTVGLVDDDVLMLRLLSLQLEQRGLEVRWAGDSREALAQLRREASHPHVVAVDVRMPGVDGFELTRRMLDAFGPLNVVMFTSMDDSDSLRSALSAGAVGYLLKTDPVERIIAGLIAAAHGLHPYSPSVGGHHSRRVVVPQDPLPAPLTVREEEVLKLVAQSLTNDQIARRLSIAPDTVKRHVAAVMNKTGTPDRLGAVMWAVRSGLIQS
ncbi:response regulator transcription factor [Tessaracoccus sp. OS52]|uniref:response regulator n=1 Tax=Tessaracoccus sp. OS52 TaxID=2886691 RepID=UPI001D122FDD|nr:response regulator transcription factor [Tessaracoccus sp. OS52]MCC2593301.1 response regulator transcription factor [Tessaracoccus sp. OS52]